MVSPQLDEEQQVSVSRPAFTIGIEEEYLLVDPETRDLVDDPPDSIMKAAEAALA